MAVLRAAERLRDATRALAFGGKVAYAYYPLEYAWDVHRRFATRYGAGRKRVLFVGMNPGPWGMTQTGAPFADARRARDWLQLTGEVRAPPRYHPKRPVLGFACPRRDVSGERFYAWAEAHWGAAGDFFADRYVVNHVPVYFVDEGARNLTPVQIPRPDLLPLVEACDEHLAAVLDAQRPARIVGVGKWGEAAARRVAAHAAPDAEIVGVQHPSPASPATNVGWSTLADAALGDLD